MKKQVLFIVLMLMPLMASAATKINGIYYNLNSTTKVAEVTYLELYKPSYEGSIVIPKTVTYGGVTFSVTSIGYYAFYYCSSLTSVTIPNSVTSIGESAFSYCTSLTSVTIPNSMTSIGVNAFSNCLGLTSITIPNSVTSIGKNAFQDCLRLTSVHITDLAAWCKINFLGDYIYGLDDWEGNYSNPLSIAHHLFLNGTEVKDLTIPNSVTSIKSYAFAGCSGLTSVTIPNSVTYIGYYAFSGCPNLTSVPIPNSVTSIGDYAFRGCSGLTSIFIPNSVTSIGNYAFRGCSGLTSIFIPNSVTSIGYEAFSGCSSLTSVTIPNSVTEIGFGIFSGCSSLTSVTIPNSVTEIGYETFRNCSNLTSVTIPNSVTSIGSSAFFGCTGLISVYITDVAAWCQLNGGYQLLSPTCHLIINELEMNNIKNLIIPEGVTSIQQGAFKYSRGLTSVTIGNDVASIGNEAFYECSDITSVTIGSSIKNIGSKAFANYNNLTDVYCLAKEVPTTSLDIFDNSYVKYATLHVPESSINLYKRSEPWSQFGSFVGIPEDNNENKCKKPIITLLANGKIKVESTTEGATCVTNITASNAEPLTDEEISLNTPLTVYTVTSYATKEGYDDSEVATATFRYEKAEGDMNGDGMLNITDVIHLVNMILGQ